MKKTDSALNTILTRTNELEPIEGFRLGTIVKMELEQNRIWVDYDGNPSEKPHLARLGTPWITSEELNLFYHKIDSVKLEFLNGNPTKPIIRDLFYSTNEINRSKSNWLADKVIELEADEIILRSSKRLVLQCGSTKTVYDAERGEITQEADQIKSSANKNNRVKGGTVLLN